MNRDALVVEACRRYDLASQAARDNRQTEFAVQNLAHAMCYAALTGKLDSPRADAGWPG